MLHRTVKASPELVEKACGLPTVSEIQASLVAKQNAELEAEKDRLFKLTGKVWSAREIRNYRKMLERQNDDT